MGFITFKNLGKAGNLGSQLQQYASLHAISCETNRRIIFPQSSLSQGYGFKFLQLVDIDIEIVSDDFFLDFIDILPNEESPIDLTLFNLNPNKNYNINGLLHVYNYWYPKYLNDILNWKWNKEHLYEAQLKYNSISLNNKETVAIHVRRGDYLLPQHHHFCNLDTSYYEEALQFFLQDLEKYHFVIFSNDIKWCKENLIEGEMVTFIEPGTDYTDLILMSLCNHQIIANSSYSWWAAFKNNNPSKKIICPTNYLKSYSPLSKIINNNYYPSDWTNIENYTN
jgi:hypothetical protein